MEWAIMGVWFVILVLIMVDTAIVGRHGKATMEKYGGTAPERLCTWRRRWRWLREYARICREHDVSMWPYRFVLTTEFIIVPALLVGWLVLGFVHG